MTKSIWPAAALLSVLLAAPAAAQGYRDEVPSGGLARNLAECDGQFKRADLDGNGVITPGEASASRGLLPTRLAGEGYISRSDFMRECNDGAKRSGQTGFGD